MICWPGCNNVTIELHSSILLSVKNAAGGSLEDRQWIGSGLLDDDRWNVRGRGDVTNDICLLRNVCRENIWECT